MDLTKHPCEPIARFEELDGIDSFIGYRDVFETLICLQCPCISQQVANTHLDFSEVRHRDDLDLDLESDSKLKQGCLG